MPEHGNICYHVFQELFKDVHANCFCASLLHTQIHIPRHASSTHAKYLNEE